MSRLILHTGSGASVEGIEGGYVMRDIEYKCNWGATAKSFLQMKPKLFFRISGDTVTGRAFSRRSGSRVEHEEDLRFHVSEYRGVGEDEIQGQKALCISIEQKAIMGTNHIYYLFPNLQNMKQAMHDIDEWAQEHIADIKAAEEPAPKTESTGSGLFGGENAGESRQPASYQASHDMGMPVNMFSQSSNTFSRPAASPAADTVPAASAPVAPVPVTPVSVTPVPVTPVSVTPVPVTPVPVDVAEVNGFTGDIPVPPVPPVPAFTPVPLNDAMADGMPGSGADPVPAFVPAADHTAYPEAPAQTDISGEKVAAAEELSAAEEASAEDDIPVAEEIPAVEDLPVAEEIPAATQSNVPEEEVSPVSFRPASPVNVTPGMPAIVPVNEETFEEKLAKLDILLKMDMCTKAEYKERQLKLYCDEKGQHAFYEKIRRILVMSETGALTPEELKEETDKLADECFGNGSQDPSAISSGLDRIPILRLSELIPETEIDEKIRGLIQSVAFDPEDDNRRFIEKIQSAPLLVRAGLLSQEKFNSDIDRMMQAIDVRISDPVNVMERNLSRWPAMVEAGILSETDFNEKRQDIFRQLEALSSVEEEGLTQKLSLLIKMREFKWLEDAVYHNHKLNILKEIEQIEDPIRRIRLYGVCQVNSFISEEDFEERKMRFLSDVLSPYNGLEEFQQRIETLIRLHDAGIIDDEGFKKYKMQLLG